MSNYEPLALAGALGFGGVGENGGPLT